MPIKIVSYSFYSAASFDHGCDSEWQSCSDICLTNVAISVFTCVCPTGINLLDDEATCKTCEYNRMGLFLIIYMTVCSKRCILYLQTF